MPKKKPGDRIDEHVAHAEGLDDPIAIKRQCLVAYRKLHQFEAHLADVAKLTDASVEEVFDELRDLHWEFDSLFSRAYLLDDETREE